MEKMEALTIVFVTNNYTPYSGGVVSSIKAFVAGLRDLGHKVYIVTLDFKDSVYEEDVVRLYCPLKFRYKDNPMAMSWYAAQALEQLFMQLKPDIVHSHHPFLLGSAAKITCKRLHIPVVFTHHTQYDQYLHYIPITKKLTRPVVNKLVVSYCNSCDLVIAPSNAIKDYLSSYPVNSLVTILPSPLLSVFADNMPKFKLKKRSKIGTLLYVGRFTQEKNISFLLDLIKGLGSGFKLQLAGYGYYQADLENYAYCVLDLTQKEVKFIQRPSKNKIAQLYQEADLFVFASTSETQGMVLIESMAAGTPVVSLKGAGQDDIVVTGKNGFLVENLQQMKTVIEDIFHDQSLFEKLQYDAWLTAKKYTISILSKDLLNSYVKLLHREALE
ncbi:TPA: hypothetical protein DIC20_03965 [Candidatus Dependentiae bacterium]|nr:MAG: Glycosyl transferase group 1 [candidate division TM6 bacterium GW2011_GWF2_36_131]KKQ03684.1 MAG: Glycosyl transferase group 1 [candidate division TM6 bacterium GW2011_GWE2_36_25]KKQ20080.1 MAG: Glycosyl transferase group 1 [candidate division TM6 bacterium GW2011_GWA2_36_9]HBR70451.1 hypothetical protein [Candidatus Dependentiae bacterium]HCU00833.1 hypothetical protein [Candidatus Dependentiae bacterium]